MPAATNANLPDMISKGLFREDLFYRLNVIHLIVPSLRERKDDLPVAGRTLPVTGSRSRASTSRARFRPQAVAMLTEYHWPGNVRELQNVIERMLIRCRTEVIGVEDVPLKIRDSQPARPRRSANAAGRSSTTSISA